MVLVGRAKAGTPAQAFLLERRSSCFQGFAVCMTCSSLQTVLSGGKMAGRRSSRLHLDVAWMVEHRPPGHVHRRDQVTESKGHDGPVVFGVGQPEPPVIERAHHLPSSGVSPDGSSQDRSSLDRSFSATSFALVCMVTLNAVISFQRSRELSRVPRMSGHFFWKILDKSRNPVIFGIP